MGLQVVDPLAPSPANLFRHVWQGFGLGFGANDAGGGSLWCRSRRHPARQSATISPTTSKCASIETMRLRPLNQVIRMPTRWQRLRSLRAYSFGDSSGLHADRTANGLALGEHGTDGGDDGNPIGIRRARRDGGGENFRNVGRGERWQLLTGGPSSPTVSVS